MKIYFDTEFGGLQKDTNLISIGLLTETGECFYAEFAGVNTKILDDWVKENVLINTIKYGDEEIQNIIFDENEYHFGTKEEIKQQLTEWLSQYDEVQLISDVCHYDMVLFIDIFGTAWDLPKNVSPVCHDVNQDIAKYESISEFEAFDRNREDFISTYGVDILGAKHNSMYDARVIKEIYEICEGK